jgi:CRISPR system Cascade subunit CasD
MSVYLRLAGPLQSWAGPRALGNFVDTKRIPTRSGIHGLVAAALGLPRGERPEWFTELTVTVRVDKPGTITKEYQTINYRTEAIGYLHRLRTAMTRKKVSSAESVVGFIPGQDGTTAVIRRTYLADAEFLVEINHPDHERVTQIAEAFTTPIYGPYLGRKAFAPTFPFLLGTGDTGLLEQAPHAGEHTKKLGIHQLKARPSEYADRTITAPSEPERHKRLEWFAKNCKNDYANLQNA